MIYIGNHVSVSDGYLAMGVGESKLGGDTFAFFTRNPRGGAAKDVPQSDIEKMVSISQKLAQTTPFLRVDFYDLEGKIYWGELTFFPASGFGKLYPDEADLKLGEWIQLPVGGGIHFS